MPSLVEIFHSFANAYASEIGRMHRDTDIVAGEEYKLVSLERVGGQYDTWVGKLIVNESERKYYMPKSVRTHLENTFSKTPRQFAATGHLAVISVNENGTKATIHPDEATLRRHMRKELIFPVRFVLMIVKLLVIR
jgi:hypothetical protein